MEPATSTATEIGLKFGIEVVKRRWGYLCHYKDNVEVIKKYLKDLQDARKRWEREVAKAENNAEEIEDDVKHWFENADKKITEYQVFLDDGGHEKTGCSIGFFPNNLWVRYQLGRKATKIAEGSNANELVNKTFARVSYLPGPSIDAALSNIGYESFASRQKIIEGITKALEDSTIRMIGVYGAGGVGKTTLVKEVAKKTLKKLFSVVVMANITRNPDIIKIQGQIAEMLGMRLEEESEIVRASHLRKRLNKEKENTLIILDDLWDGLDLNMLGIPCGGDDDDDDGSQRVVKDVADDGSQSVVKDVADIVSNKMEKEKLFADYKGCKLLLTSRSREVLCNELNVKEDSTFSVGILEEKEAVTLLKKEAGIQDENSRFDIMAIEIAKMCARFPIAIVSIGRSLKNKSPFAWEDVHRQLKRHSFTGGQESIEFSTKLSYDHLKNEELKSIFLLCARMGNDPLIMDLVKYCIGLGMLEGINTIREARDRVHVLIEELKDSTLLVGSYSKDRFDMHDIVRGVAMSIASKDKHVFTLKNAKLDEWPNKNKIKRYTVISLHHCDIIDELPESVYCPRLEVFHVDSSDPLLKIPENFFKGMRELKVLILTGFHLSCLPSSIKYLTNLRMLCLERCTLGENLSIIGELKKLRILTLSRSNIESLPFELGQLDKLQLLDLSNCSKLKVIPSNIISRLNSLEEFYTRDNLIQWEAEQRNQGENANLSELRHLNRLATLEIHIPSVDHFPRNLFFDRLDSYKIVIGEFNMLSIRDFKMPDKYEALKFLALQLKDGSDIHSEKGIKMLFKRVEKLLLGELNGVHNVLYELSFEGFPNLNHFSIVNNFGIRYIIKSMEQLQPLEAFPKLESMFLYKLENLEKICDSQLTDASFRGLKIIKIKTCGQLENLFLFSMVRLLTELETIEVCDCDSVKEIVSVERQVNTINDVKDDKIELPQLRFLTLQSLPAFACFYANDMMRSVSQLYEDQVPNRDRIEDTTEARQNACLSLFSEKVSIPKLECLGLSSINIQKIWSDQSLPSQCFQNLLTLNVTDCGNLNYLLSFSMAGSLVNLQSLFVSGCEMMEDIFSMEDAREIDVFPKLKKMEITNMEKLNNIWHPNIGLHSLGSLEFVIIEECHKLVTLFPGYMGGRFQSLQTLEVINCKSMENIFDLGGTPLQIDGRNETNLRIINLEHLPNLVNVWKEDPQGSLNFNNLRMVHIHRCHNVKNVFPQFFVNCLEKLESLDLFSCSNMKEIVARDEGSNENTIMLNFPQLTFVSLRYLPEFSSFCSGRHALEWPSLKRFGMVGCTESTNSEVKPIFLATEKVISNLEDMSMSLKEAKWLQGYIGNIHRMHKLKSLVLNGLQNSEILFWFLPRIPNLERLTFINCRFKEVWAPGSLVADEKIGTVVQLRELQLRNVFFLQQIGFEYDILLQRIERLVIFQCPNLIDLVPSSVSFTQLTYFEVSNCNKLGNLMTSSTAKSLVQLKTMKVIQCKLMMEIVTESKNKEEKVEEIDFRHLKSLELVSLESLTSFCSSANCGLKFPVLEKLVVSECPRMKEFSQRVNSLPNLQKVCVAEGEDEDRWYWEGDLNATMEKIFMEKVSFEYLKHLRLSHHPELNQVWHGKISLTNNCFCNLKKLVVENCEFLTDFAIPSYVLPYLKNLEELQIKSCSAVEVIFDINDTEVKKTKGFSFCLKKMTLGHLPCLKHIWNKNPQGIFSFPNLREVVVMYCGSLTTLLPSSLARNLVKLKALEIQKCNQLLEIVGKEDSIEHESNEKFVFEFPCLSSLVLFRLPQLMCFYLGRHHLECPKLESLDVSCCGKLKLFTSEFHGHQEALPEDQVSAPTNILQKPLFLVQKVIPNLKGLTLNEKGMIMLSDGRFPPDFLHKLNHLELCFEDANEKANLPFEFLQKAPNLEYLLVRLCNGLKEIFPSQKPEVHNEILARLKELYLDELSDLNSIGLEHSWVKPHCEKIKTLGIYSCSSLKQLVCREVSFSSLKELLVVSCDGLEYLFTFSTAKSLVQLEKLIIEECESIKEIVTNGDEFASDEIKFGRLYALALYSLPSLVSFYSGNATMQFLRLGRARVIQCPMMKTFSRGVINAPIFSGVLASFDRTDIHFHDDLNTTTKKMFEEKVAWSYIQHLKLGDHPELEEIWLGLVPIPTNCFKNLKSLIVVKCEYLSSVIPFNLIPILGILEEMEVSNCESVKAIFDLKDTKEGKQMIIVEPASLVSLPLKKLTLKQLPNLEHIWNMNPDGILSLQDLQEMYVYSCRSLKSLFRTSVANHVVKLGVKDCEGLVEIVAEDKAALNGTTKQFVFHCLTSLTLSELSELKYFYPGKHLLEWPMLKELDVHHCDQLKLFTNEHQSCGDAHLEDQQAFISVEKVFPNLEKLQLKKEDAMMIRQGQLHANLHRVKLLGLICFHDEADIFPYGFLQKVPNIEGLRVYCSSFKEIFSSERPIVDDTGSVLSQLKWLTLSSLSKLSSIGLEHSWVEPLLQTLEKLEVLQCSCLETLVPSTLSFSNLTDMTVSECHGMVYLLTSSTAKSLGLLKQMSIDKCESMQEIVARADDHDSDEAKITFGQLATVFLRSLPRLVGFYTGTSRLEFPSLQELSVSECGSMRIFCEGDIYAPQMPSDPNNLIRKLFDERNLSSDK